MKMKKKNQDNLWNDNCNKILNKYARGVIDYKEYCELMEAEDKKILAERQVKKDDKARD